MSHFEAYSKQYSMIEMRREEGILEMRFHTEGGPLRWSLKPHAELEQAFLDVGRDPANEVVILTGTGDEFSGPRVGPEGHNHKRKPVTPAEWYPIGREGRHLQMNLLNIEVPVISAINGPAYRHAEIPLLSDIVIASETAAFQDSAHFTAGLLPGDGVHIVFPHLMGPNRGRYFLLTGQTLNAEQALSFGLVNEVVAPQDVLSRAWEHARLLMQQTPLLRRYSRELLTHELKKKMHDMLAYGLALEGFAASQQKSA
jgi:enoyl-CoA hydratase/carnithine racemase